MDNFSIEFISSPISNQHRLPRELLEFQLPPKTLARDVFLLNIASVAALTWVVYDMVLNFNREVTLVWKRWRSSKGRHSRRLYVIVRYFSVINLAWYVGVNTSVGLSFDALFSCRAWYYIVLVNTSIITLLPDVMLLIRVNAVYAWNVRTLLLTMFLFIIQTATSLAVGFLSVSSAQFLPRNSFPVTGCPAALSANVARFTLFAWIPSILAQATYFVIMLNALAHLIRSLDVGTRTPPATNLPPPPPVPSSSPRLIPPSPLPQALMFSSSRANSRISASTQRSVPFSPLSSSSSSKSTRHTSFLPSPNMSKLTSKSSTAAAASTSQTQTDADYNMNDSNVKSNVNDTTNLSKANIGTAATATDVSIGKSLIPSSLPSPLHSPNPSTSSSKTQAHLRSSHVGGGSTSKKPEADHNSLFRTISTRNIIHAGAPPERKGSDSTAGSNETNQYSKNTSHVLSLPALFYLFSWKRLKQVQKLVPTMMVFVSHGGWYFALGILAKVVNAVMVTSFTGPMQAFAIPFMMALYPILVTRIYMSMVQYLHYGVPMKSPRLLASFEGQDFASGYGGDEMDYQDDDYDDDNDYDIAMDDAFDRHGTESVWETEERLTLGRLKFDGSRYDSRRLARPGRDKDVATIKGKQGMSRHNSDMRNSRIRGPRLGRITFAVRESLANSSVLDLGFLRDEDF